MTTQIALRISDELAAEVDAIVAAGDDKLTRSDALRLAIEQFVMRYRAGEIDRAFVEGYRRFPASEPDEWGSLDTAHAVAAAYVAQCLDSEDGGW
jgi:hypothetical protein